MEHNRIETITTIVCFIVLMFSGCKDEGEINIVGGNARIVMYSTDATNDGFLSNRTTADGYCMASSQQPLGFSNVRSLISFDPTDDIQDMPSNYGIPTDVHVASTNGLILFDDWIDMTDNSGNDVSLSSAGVLPPGTKWWSGSEGWGNRAPFHCLAWTSGSGSEFGAVGSSDSTGNNDWINDLTNPTCDNGFYLLCVAYQYLK